MSSSSSCCYICLGDNKKKRFAEKMGCHCKGSVSIHMSCFKKWVDSTENPLCCSVCKSEYSVSFLTKFLTPGQILFCGDMGDEEDYEDVFMEEQTIHGVPVLVDEDRYIHFEHPMYESIFMHSNKMELKGVRQSCHQRSKQPIHNNRGRQYNRISFSRKR